MTKKLFNIYLVSDSSGETVITVSKATLVQFSNIDIIESAFLLVRTHEQIDVMIKAYQANPGVVIYTMGYGEVKDYFLAKCTELSIPVICPLDNIVSFFARYLSIEPSDISPGKYKVLNKSYYEKINSINYAINHDDGQHPEGYNKADIILLGVSRTSKSPTSLYLGQRGYNVANYPIVPGLDFNIPNIEKLLGATYPIVVGLTISPQHLLKIRNARLSMLYEQSHPHIANAQVINHYASNGAIIEEINYANKLFQSLKIPIIDVTNKAIEETAAALINLYNSRSYHTKPCSTS